MKSGTKALSILLIGILLSSSFQSSFENFLSGIIHDNNTGKAFAQSAIADIHNIGSYAIFGLHQVVLEKNLTVVNGSVGVNDASPDMKQPENTDEDVSNTAITVKKGSTFLDPNSALVGDAIIIEKNATVQSIFYNNLQNSGTILGPKNTPLSLPVVSSLPSFPHSTPGTTPVTVPDGTSLTLKAGQYSDLSVGKDATLVFEGGIYNVTSIKADKDSKLFFATPSQVVVRDKIELDKGDTLGPFETSSLSASDIVVFVGDGISNNKSIEFGKNSLIRANIFSPNGEIDMDKDTKATGAFIANEIKIDKDSTIAFDSAFGDKAGHLVSQYKHIITDLGKMSDIADQSVVTDYLNQNITGLKSLTSTQVLDAQTRNSLLSILDSALQSVNNAGSSVLALDKTGANTKINDAKSFINNYVSQVTASKGTTIPSAVADLLLFNANRMLTDSVKNGADSPTIIVKTQLVVTGQIIDRAKTDEANLKQINSKLKMLGFTVTLDAQHHSPTVVDISFSNSQSSQFFDVIMPSSTLATFITLDFIDEAKSGNVDLTQEQVASLLNTTPIIVNKIVNSADIKNSIGFAIYAACPPNFGNQTCQSTFNDPFGIGAGFRIGPGGLSVIGGIIISAIGYCFGLDVCQFFIDEINQELTNFARESFNNNVYAFATISGIKFNDIDGDRQQNGPAETGLGGWNFVLFPILTGGHPGTPLQTVTSVDGSGNFQFTNVRYVKVTTIQLGIKELLKNGWLSTTGQEIHIDSTPNPATNQLIKSGLAFGNQLQPPVITSPTNGATVTTSPTITGTALPGATITVFDGATQIGLIVADSNGNWSLSPLLSSGTHTITATQTISNNISPKSTAVTFTFTPQVVSPIFFDNFDDGPLTSTGWSPVSCPSGLDCIGQSTLSQLGFPAISQPFWGFVRNFAFGSFFCPPSSVATSKSFTVTQAGNYNVSAWIAPSICEGCIIHNQLFVDSNLLFDHGVGFVSPGPPPVFDKTVIPLSAGTHSVTMQMFATAECNGAFPTYMDNISIQQTSSPATPPSVGGPYFSLQVNQTSVNATKGSTTVVPLKVIWDMGHNAKPVSAKFMGNTTSVIPSITSVSNTTSSQLFNVTLNVPSGVQTGNYYVAINIIEPDGNSQVISIPVRVQ